MALSNYFIVVVQGRLCLGRGIAGPSEGHPVSSRDDDDDDREKRKKRMNGANEQCCVNKTKGKRHSLPCERTSVCQSTVSRSGSWKKNFFLEKHDSCGSGRLHPINRVVKTADIWFDQGPSYFVDLPDRGISPSMRTLVTDPQIARSGNQYELDGI